MPLAESTIWDVANEAKVSISTVSKVLNGKGNISLETQRKVIDAAKVLNYFPNSIAVSMVLKKSNIIGIVVPYVDSPFYSDVIQGAETAARRFGYYTMIFCTDEEESNEKIFFAGNLGRLVDGVIIIPSVNKAEIYENYSKPIVMVDRYVEKTKIDSVIIDNYNAAYQLTELMLSYGHKRIAFISGPPDINVGVDRLRGFEQAARDAAISVDSLPIHTGSWLESYGYQVFLEDIANRTDISGVIAGNGSIGMGILIACQERGVVVGKDISLAVVDDTILARFNRNQVTVADRPSTEMGCMAVELLIARLEAGGKSSSYRKTVLPVSIIERDSIVRLVV